MIELLRFFLRLARLKQAPQDLPASAVLLWLCLLANLAIGVAGGARYFGGAPQALLANLLDTSVIVVMVWLLLTVNGRRPRLAQTLTALFGLGALFGVAMIVVDGIGLVLAPGPGASLAALVLLVWAHVAGGHVLRHALDQPLAAGIALAVGISVVSFVVVGNLLAPPASPTAG